MGSNEASMVAPKIELHCHIEGTVAPSLAKRLAAKYGIDLSGTISPEGLYRFGDFTEFLRAYDATCSAIRTPEDYYQVLYDYYRDAAAEGLIYGEMFISPVHASTVGMSYETFIGALDAALDDVERDHGVMGRLVLTAIRHLGVEHAEETARLAAEKPFAKVVGFGLAGEESFLRPRDFARAYRLAADAGLKLTAHAGELCGPESVREALRELNVARVGHGVRSIEDSSVMDELRERGTVLEVCPSSNVTLGLFPSLERHPVAALTAYGLNTTLGSDDPPFVLTTIGGEYQKVQAAHCLSDADMSGFTLRGLAGAFCSDAEKAALRARLTADGGAFAA